MSHRVLVVGKGGREHAICWKLYQSPHISHLFVLPGSYGISQLGPKCHTIGADVVDPTDFEVSYTAVAVARHCN